MKTRPSRPIRCDVLIVERMRYPTDQPTDKPTQPVRGASSHPKKKLQNIDSPDLNALVGSIAYSTCEKIKNQSSKDKKGKKK